MNAYIEPVQGVTLRSASGHSGGLRPEPPSASRPCRAPAVNADELLAAAAKLLSPTTGIMRGIYATDPGKKLIRIRISELRALESFILAARRLAEETSHARD